MRLRYPLAWYFALAFGISWIGVGFAASQGRLDWLVVAMLLGPSLASLGLTAAFEGAQGLRDLGRSALRWRVGGRWYMSLGIAPALVATVLFALSLLLPSFSPAIVSGGSPTEILAFAAIAGFGAGIFEELGWTGFATQHLLRRYTWFGAGLALGVPWALWHLFADFVGRDAHTWWWAAHVVEWIVALTAFRVVMTWVYSRTESLFLAMLLHASFTGSQLLLWPSSTAPGVEVVWYGLFACALWVVVAIVNVVDLMFVSVAASRPERVRPMKGDHLVPDPMFTVTHAITIDRPPEDVWPWLAQMGSLRAGWYSFDRIDNDGVPSASHVIAQYQEIAKGDVLPALPGASGAFLVTAIEPPRDLILTVPGEPGPVVCWEHLVEPIAPNQSRLIVRGRVARSWKKLARSAGGERPRFIERVYRLAGRLPDAFMIAVASLGHRWMEARHMRGIKRRAEAAV